MEKLSSDLQSTRDPAGLRAIAEGACEALGQYNRSAQRVQGAQTVELRCMIEMLSQALVALAGDGGQSVEALLSIRKQVESAAQLDDIRLVRARLADSLKAISEEAKRQRERNVEMLAQARDAVRFASENQRDPDIDRLSGLASFQKAEVEIAARLAIGPGHYAAIFVLERLDSVNLRYGPATGDRLLQAFSRRLLSCLSPQDQVFRWRGPAFMALLLRPGSPDSVRAELARFAKDWREQTQEIDGEPLRPPIGCAWTVRQLPAFGNAQDACRQIDRFVAESGERKG